MPGGQDLPETITDPVEDTNPYRNALRQLENVARVLHLDDDIHAVLQKP
jgi:hypothetical protein